MAPQEHSSNQRASRPFDFAEFSRVRETVRNQTSFLSVAQYPCPFRNLILAPATEPQFTRHSRREKHLLRVLYRESTATPITTGHNANVISSQFIASMERVRQLADEGIRSANTTFDLIISGVPVTAGHGDRDHSSTPPGHHYIEYRPASTPLSNDPSTRACTPPPTEKAPVQSSVEEVARTVVQILRQRVDAQLRQPEVLAPRQQGFHVGPGDIHVGQRVQDAQGVHGGAINRHPQVHGAPGSSTGLQHSQRSFAGARDGVDSSSMSAMGSPVAPLPSSSIALPPIVPGLSSSPNIPEHVGHGAKHAPGGGFETAMAATAASERGQNDSRGLSHNGDATADGSSPLRYCNRKCKGKNLALPGKKACRQCLDYDKAKYLKVKERKMASASASHAKGPSAPSPNGI
jgi:hypothetical protein